MLNIGDKKVLLVTDAIPTYSTNKIGDLIIVNSENVTKFCRGSIKNKGVLELTSLSDITDEDVMAVCRINRPDVNWRGYKVADRKKLALRFAEYNIFSYQYLQSKGYAIKWLNYSVDELIEAGYLVLKKGGDNGIRR